jgi:hypothetical protein
MSHSLKVNKLIYQCALRCVALSENFGGILAKPNVPSVGSGNGPVFSKSL